MITGKMLRDAIISGANAIINNKTTVDELNVFPVPDGDTGTNMSMTIGSAKKELEAMPDDATVEKVASATSNAMLREKIAPLNPVFAKPEFSTDNAMGVAVLAHRQMGG